jgi:pimeloyl-[acyl-carrier protein] methyl ester esterase
MMRAAMSPHVVLLHGWGMARTVWDDVIASLQPRFRVTAPDLPGYGGTDACMPYTLQRLTERLAAQAPPHCAVVGWSLGAQVALRWASLYSEQVTRIALIACTPSFVARADWPHGMEGATLESFAVALHSRPEETLARFVLLQAQGDLQVRAVAKRLRAHSMDRVLPSRAALEGGLSILRDSDLREHLHAVMQPALILHGEADTLVPPGAAKYLQAALPHARLVLLPGVAHAPVLSAPGVIAERLASFLHE